MAYSETTQNFFENFRQIRRWHNLTVEEMAAKLGLEPRQVQLLEEDIMPCEPTSGFLEKLYTEFGIPAARLLLPPSFQPYPPLKNSKSKDSDE